MSTEKESLSLLDKFMKKDEWVYCPCQYGTYLTAKPLPGSMSKCLCDNDFKKAQVARIAKNAELKKHIVESVAAAASKPKPFPENCPAKIEKAVHKTFKSIVVPAFEDDDGFDEWDPDILGTDPVEAMEKFNEDYAKYASGAARSKVLDSWRKESSNAEIVKKLIEQMNDFAAAH